MEDQRDQGMMLTQKDLSASVVSGIKPKRPLGKWYQKIAYRLVVARAEDHH